jgi:uncharacterized protein YciI
MHRTILVALAIATLPSYGAAPVPPNSLPIKRPADPVLAKQLGADERGMRSYVLVVLKSGPTPVPAGPARDEMFRGHFANINRLAAEGKLAVAGPFDGSKEWRGMFIFAVDKIEAAKVLVATDPVIQQGEMVAEYHTLYASAALMAVNGLHAKIEPR